MATTGRTSFIIRLWTDDDSDAPDWRFHVHHIQSGEDEYFSSSAAVLSFIERHSDAALPFEPIGVPDPKG